MRTLVITCDCDGPHSATPPTKRLTLRLVSLVVTLEACDDCAARARAILEGK